MIVVALASDHAGVGFKKELGAVVTECGFEPLDHGVNDAEKADYPVIANTLASMIAQGQIERGILICGTGIGISIAANRHRGVRAALCHDVTTSRLVRQHNDANVLVLGARVLGPQVARECVEVFLSTSFEEGRHRRRVEQLG
jgi:ribose 5-phosphate isomerase B